MAARGARYGLPLVAAAAILLAIVPAVAANGDQDYTRSPGEQVYVDAGCQVCHGAMGRGGVGVEFFGDPFLAFPDYIVARILVGGGEMPGFDGKLSDDEIAAVATYLQQSWGAKPGHVTAKQVASYRQKILPETTDKSTKQASP
ncbi:MAG TPA: cytochrome c [Pararhizobium sp.]|nr:cytochrome c [Pararhizobium sp.]